MLLCGTDANDELRIPKSEFECGIVNAECGKTRLTIEEGRVKKAAKRISEKAACPVNGTELGGVGANGKAAFTGEELQK